MPAGIIASYPFLPDRYDEMLVDKRTARPSWQAFADRLEFLPQESLVRRAEFVNEAIEADGVTYSVHTALEDSNRPWELDMLPLILGHEEWAKLSAGVKQRARLLDAMLADLYGPQHLLKEGLVPPALVYGQRGYKWPCQNIQPVADRFMHLFAVDIARAPNGQWWVIGDHTQTPTGAGYVVQNRIVTSQAFPDAFREMQVHTLAAFFRNLQDSLARMAPADGDTPLTVLLSGGPAGDSYFEHAFLARYLGFPLVEGQDLTVREDTVFLKTLRGLRRVHAIVRRLEDDYCDPLEMRGGSALGVPGLLGAIRAKRVLMANALGSGAVEGSALFGFLPAICLRLLDEPLEMPSVASWWCGEPPALEYVLDNLDELVIKPAFSNMRRESAFGHQLKGKERDTLIASIRAQPHTYVAQEWVRLSQAPVWIGGDQPRLASRAVCLRMFAAATPEDYEVMPGALGRVAPHSGVEMIPMHRGGGSKDTWVRAEGAAHRTTNLKKRLGVIDLLYSGNDIPSRVGENLFWMGRHSERCESSARVLRAAISRTSSTYEEAAGELDGLLLAARNIGAISAKDSAEIAEDETTREALLLSAVSDLKQYGSVASNLQALASNASHVRERLSSDNWRLLNRLSQVLQPPPTTVNETMGALDSVIMNCISLAGFAMDDMTRDEGWRFLILGRRIERLAGLSSMISLVLQAEERASENMLEWLLEATNAIVTYRARYRRMPELLPVIHLLVFDTSNPHSVCFQIQALSRYLKRSARELRHPVPPLIDELENRFDRFDLTVLEAEHCAPGRARLAKLLTDAENTAYAVSDEVHRRFFIHTVSPSRLRGVA